VASKATPLTFEGKPFADGERGAAGAQPRPSHRAIAEGERAPRASAIRSIQPRGRTTRPPDCKAGSCPRGTPATSQAARANEFGDETEADHRIGEVPGRAQRRAMTDNWAKPERSEHVFVVLRQDGYVDDPIEAITGTKA
jgi:hypothetical protein